MGIQSRPHEVEHAVCRGRGGCASHVSTGTCHAKRQQANRCIQLGDVFYDENERMREREWDDDAEGVVRTDTGVIEEMEL